VIESVLRRFPMNQLEVHAIVVGVASGAIFAAGLLIPNCSMVSPPGGQSRRYLRVALQALQVLAPRGQFMAGNALRRTI
jgi:hypothetical protein